MASNYPGSLDSFDTIASDKKTSDSVGGRTHRQMHNDLGDAVEAVQAELGTDPAGSYSTVKARLDALVAYAAKTSAYTATVADHTLNVTSGTFTLDLPAASTCTGQSLRVKNSGTGVVTLDGNSSETVEGVATFPLGPGSYVEITSTGSAWILTVGVADTGWRKFTVADTSVFHNASYNAANASSVVWLRRVGNRVHFEFSTLATNAWTTNYQEIITLPAAFRPNVSDRTLIPAVPLANKTNMTLTTQTLYVAFDEAVGVIRNGNGWTSVDYQGSASWATGAAWPTSLPGTAV